MHGLAHLLVHRGNPAVNARVVPGEAHAPGDVLNDPEVSPGLPRRVNGLLSELHHAVGVAHGAGFFGPGGGGQHHVGQPGGLGHEDVLHHQVLQAGQGMAGMVQVGVAHGRVFAHDVHAAHLMRIAVRCQRFVHDLDYGVAGLIVKLGIPEFFEPAVRGRVGHALVVGEHHRNQAGIAGALHIILATQGVQSGTRLANLPGDAHQRDQATRVVGAVHMLADAHAPQNHGAFGLGKGPRYLAQGLRRDAADRCHRLRAVAFHVLAQRLKIVGTPGNEVLVGQAFVDHGVDQRIEHGHVGVRFELQRAPGVFADVGHARVGQHNLGASFGRVLHPGGSHRVVGGGVGADQQDQLRVRHVVDLVADCARAHTLQQGSHAGGVAQPGAVVNIVGAKAGAYQLLEQVGFFVAALGRAKASQSFGAVLDTQPFEPTRGQRHRLVPAGFTENS